MRKYFYIIMTTILVMGNVSCQSKSDRIEDLREYVEEIGEEGKEYSEEQLEEIDEKFTEMVSKLEDYDDLTSDEIRDIARIKGRYAATVLKKSGKSIMEKMDKAGDALEGFLEGIVED